MDYIIADGVKKSAVRSLKYTLNKVPELKGHNLNFMLGLIATFYEDDNIAGQDDLRGVIVDIVMEGIGQQGASFLDPMREVMKKYGEFSMAIVDRQIRGAREMSLEAIHQNGFILTGVCGICEKPRSHIAQPDSSFSTYYSYCNTGCISRWKISPLNSSK